MFDSGIGGLTVLAKALELMPDAEYLYYADPDNAPYGTKTTDQVKEYSDRAVSFLISLGAEAVVIACNTATSAAASFKFHPSILNIYKVFINHIFNSSNTHIWNNFF